MLTLLDRQLWGFSDVNGERWLTRRLVLRKIGNEEVLRTRLVYEWLGEGEDEYEDEE